MPKLHEIIITGQELRARLTSVENKQDGHAQETHTRLANIETDRASLMPKLHDLIITGQELRARLTSVENKQDGHAHETHTRLANIEKTLAQQRGAPVSGQLAPPARSPFSHFEGSPDQGFGHVTYAQFGEDLIVANMFALLGIERPSYLDLGANDPIAGSNTALLYRRGSRGVAVEANPNWEPVWRETRPRDVFLNVGVADQPGELTFHFIDDLSGRNTFDPAYAAALSAIDSGFRVRETATIKTMRLNDIVDRIMGGQWPDFLSVDIEGLDHAVLAGATFGDNRPLVMCIETRDGAGTDTTESYLPLLKAKGYVPMTRTWGNLIAIHRDAAAALSLPG